VNTANHAINVATILQSPSYALKKKPGVEHFTKEVTPFAMSKYHEGRNLNVED